MTRWWTLACVLPLLLGAARPLQAQEAGGAAPPLEHFVQQVLRHWGTGDAGSLVDLAPEDGQILLDAGSGTEMVNARHAAAALRALFAERESLGVRAVRVTLSGGSPPRGFGELAWSFRVRGAPTTQLRSVYVGAVWEEGGWRISELRIMP